MRQMSDCSASFAGFALDGIGPGPYPQTPQERGRASRSLNLNYKGNAMRTLMGAVVILAFAGFAGAARQDKDKDKVDLKKLMGKWEPKDQGVIIEFADKGKLIISIDGGGKSEKIEGTYKAIEGNKLEVVIAFGGKEQKETLTVKKLTDDELITADGKGKEETLKKKK